MGSCGFLALLPEYHSKVQHATEPWLWCHVICQHYSCLVLNGCSQAMGLHCISASVEVGNAVLTASSALLSALTTLAVLGKQNKAAQLAGATRLRHTKSGFKKLSVAAFDKLVASLPDEVGSDLTTHCPGKWALHHVHDVMVTRCIVLYTVV